MPYLELDPPDWESLLGGTQEAAWIADRNRKFGLAAAVAGRMLDLAAHLDQKGALFQCSADVLEEFPDAADWYVSLAGFSMKTLQNISLGPGRYGLNRKVKTLVERLRGHMPTERTQLEAFSSWINSELDGLYPLDERDSELAKAVVFIVLGGRVIGQGQNLGGDDAVDLLKTLLVEAFERRRLRVEVQLDDGNWADYRPEHNLPRRQRIRFCGRVVCEFVSGGDRPDIVILFEGVTVAVGEIKGRKDLSNVWESWMPGVYNHMRTWTGQNPDALRLFFGTLINDSMINGASSAGTQHVGLKKLHQQGLLNAAYNISKVAENDLKATRQFDQFVDRLTSLAKGP